ncbi:helicase-associated domain-containing protein [Georgenia sp. TF02-10]|uniref:helicase-associated domain-containing protein n=1 Tax=Georgenia sp. TF02-10 TaxID=2917725 RepID=UPI001FA7F3C4|nr:helicase-associated domain-containing protein [Georgenia sp. TF02-10]UNX55339.1 helicase-associated domain-containing protein [Georgenia sp. TF02-10]
MGTTERLADELAGRTDEALAHLLAVRPDLATPPASSLTALAARAASRGSVERALAGLTAVELAVAEALVALAPVQPPTPAALARATGLAGGPELDRLAGLALVVGGEPLPAMAEALGPYPAGLGPTLADLEARLGPADVPAPTTEAALHAALAGAPAAATGTLDALTWGPPVGHADPLPGGVRWLLDHGLLRRLSPTQVVLPREVALAARGGRTHREPPAPPPADALPTRPAAVVEAEGARAAEEVDRLLGVLVETWHATPATMLRAGGVGVREIRRTAAALEVPEERAGLLAELAAMAGLLAHEAEPAAWTASRAAADFRADPLPERWAQVAEAWLGSVRTPWLIGSRSDQGTLRAALEPTLERGWAGELRRRVLAALADLPAGTAPDPAAVHALLAWQRPRATAPEATVAAVLAEAEVLGVTGAGALTAAGRALVAGAGPDAVAAALAAALPTPVAELVVQGDLTAVVPGRPDPVLADLLALSAQVESRGAALTVRFTTASVREALDAGLGPEELLGALARYSSTPLPQPLEYLVRDTARRHGQVRVGTAGAYLRADDAAALAGLPDLPELAGLGLRPIAPTVLVAAAPPGEVLHGLRAAGLAPVLEGPDGVVVLRGLGDGWAGGAGGRERGIGPDRGDGGERALGRGRGVAGQGLGGQGAGRCGRGPVPGAPAYPGAPPSTYQHRPSPAELATTVRRMRAAEAAARRDSARAGGGPAATDPVHALVALREAAAAGRPVEVVLVGATGQRERRRVQPVHVDGGRVRLRDLDRDAEITVAVHRIHAVGAG